MATGAANGTLRLVLLCDSVLCPAITLTLPLTRTPLDSRPPVGVVQPDALAYGKSVEELQAEGVPPALHAHKEFPGNRPSLSFLFPALTPYTCGQVGRLVAVAVAMAMALLTAIFSSVALLSICPYLVHALIYLCLFCRVYCREL